MNIFKLFGSVFVDTDAADKSLAKTDKNATSLGTKFVSGAKTVAKFGAAVGVAAAAGGAAMYAMAVKTGETADRLLDLQSITGMSTDEIQKWERVTTVAGVSLTTMTDASAKLTKTMDIMSTGTGKAAEAADALGYSYEDLSAMDADERMNVLTDALGKVTDKTTRAKLGTDLFGSSWEDLAPVLDVGAEKLADIKDNANIFSEEDLNKANDFRIKIDTLKETVGIFGQKLALQFLPILTTVLDWISSHMPEIEEFMVKAFDFISNAVTVTIEVFKEYFLPILQSVFEWVKENMPLIKETIKTAFNIIMDVVKAAWTVFKDYLLPIFVSMFNWVSDNWPTIKKVAETVFSAIVVAVKAVWSFVEEYLLPILKSMFEWVSDNWPTIQKVFETVFDAIIFVAKGLWDQITLVWNVVSGLYTFIRDVFSGTGDLIRSAFSGILDFLSPIIDKFNAVKDAIGGAVSKVKEFVGIDEDSEAPTYDAYNTPTHDASYQGMATGGNVLKGGMVTVGERGRENLYLPTGAQVRPLSDDTSGKQVNVNVNGATFINDQAVSELVDIFADYLSAKGVTT